MPGGVADEDLCAEHMVYARDMLMRHLLPTRRVQESVPQVSANPEVSFKDEQSIVIVRIYFVQYRTECTHTPRPAAIPWINREVGH